MTPTTAPTPISPPALTTRATSTYAGPHLVALDIDGTLTEDARLDVPKATIEAVAAARRAGHHIVLASGRSLAGVLPIARLLDLDGWVVASNGAVIARVDPTAQPDGYAIPPGDAQFLDVRAATDPAIMLQLSIAVENIGAGYFVTNRFPAHMLRGTQTWAPLSALEALDTPRIVLHGTGAHDLIDQLRAAGLTVTPAGIDRLDVTPGGVSKATALETIRERLGVDPAGTIAVGDGINDLEALIWAARGVAMGHAPLEVRDAADEITGSLDQAGAAMVLRSLPNVLPAAG